MNNKLKIVQISDLHCGSSHFDKNLMEKTIEQVNKYNPEVLIITGDLTMEGYYEEYTEALNYINMFTVKNKVIIPGNHDSKNVGYRTFEKLIGKPFSTLTINDTIICGADSTEPDLDDGQIGRAHTAKLKSLFSKNYDFKILALHHHVISVPNSGREMNILRDAGDVLKMAVKTGVDLILSGHKHIPHMWNFENLKIITCSTTTSRRLRGIYKPSYNIIEIDNNLIIKRKDVEGGTTVICREKRN
ncbi:MAG TPA: metallophosphoesterase family protein [Victivallales bacterium]|nr:metallophosphoesterase family protein [Victivallales bacterium]